MTEVYIKKTARTAHGKRNGMFRNVDAVELSSAVIKHLDVVPNEVIWGCVQQFGVQGYNVARQAALKAGLPNNVPAVTTNRLCGSSMSAVHQAYANIKAGLGDMYIVGGVEHMTHNPMTEHYKAPKQMQGMAAGSAMMGLTAEMVGQLNSISREEADKFAAWSHRLAFAEMHKDINVIVPGHAEDGSLMLAKRDEPIRPEANAFDMKELKGAFDVNGNVTAGNSSAIADGASGAVITSEKDGAVVRIVDVAVSAGDPAVMGYQPVYAVKKLLAKTDLRINDIGVWEINEAFAAQSLAVIKGLEIDKRKINQRGGSIAIGHPLGSSGTRILHTLINVMEDTGQRYGVATMCVGLGQAVATLVELV